MNKYQKRQLVNAVLQVKMNVVAIRGAADKIKDNKETNVISKRWATHIKAKAQEIDNLMTAIKRLNTDI